MTEPIQESAEDVAAALHRGRPVRDHGPYVILIADEGLEFTPRRIADPVPTGDQILDAAGIQDKGSHQVLQLLATGETEGLRPNETTDLRATGVERFVVFRTDRLYRFTLDGRALDWGAQRISGRTLLMLARKDPNAFDVSA